MAEKIGAEARRCARRFAKDIETPLQAEVQTPEFAQSGGSSKTTRRGPCTIDRGPSDARTGGGGQMAEKTGAEARRCARANRSQAQVQTEVEVQAETKRSALAQFGSSLPYALCPLPCRMSHPGMTTVTRRTPCISLPSPVLPNLAGPRGGAWSCHQKRRV